MIDKILKRLDELEAQVSKLPARIAAPSYVPRMYQGVITSSAAPGYSGAMSLISRDNTDSGISVVVWNYFANTTATEGTVWWAYEQDGVIRLLVGECP